MRGLNERFLSDLKDGFLEPVRRAVIMDRDLVFSIREKAINIYYKGNSLLALTQTGRGYDVGIHPKFRIPGIDDLKSLQGKADVDRFIKALPHVKERIIALHKGGNEIEFEQMLIRANTREPRLLTDYLIIDRQLVTADRKGRFDLTAVYLPRGKWHRSKEVALALLEIKFGLNQDIGKIHEQLTGYYGSVATHLDEIAGESETLLRQQVELELIAHPKGRLKAFGKLRISRDITKARFAIVLVDYAPASKTLNLDKLGALPFADQIDIFQVGFGLWQANAVSLAGHAQ